MSYTKLANTIDVPPGTMKTFDVSGRKILLANADGTFFAIDNKCPHIGKPMSNGKFDGTSITCPFHGAQFDVRTGENTTDAHFLFWNMHCKNAHTYRVQLLDNDIFVEV